MPIHAKKLGPLMGLELNYYLRKELCWRIAAMKRPDCKKG
jgi:hypothetical protein